MLIPKMKHNVCKVHLQTAKMKFNVSIIDRETFIGFIKQSNKTY